MSLNNKIANICKLRVSSQTFALWKIFKHSPPTCKWASLKVEAGCWLVRSLSQLKSSLLPRLNHSLLISDLYGAKLEASDSYFTSEINGDCGLSVTETPKFPRGSGQWCRSRWSRLANTPIPSGGDMLNVSGSCSRWIMHSTCSGAAELPSTEQFLDQSSLKKNFGLLFLFFFNVWNYRRGGFKNTAECV